MKKKRIFTKSFSLSSWNLNIKTGSNESETWINHILTADVDVPQREDEKNEKPFLALKVLAFFVFAILLLKLYSLQIQGGSSNRSVAEENRVRSTIIPAPRGVILDRTGTALVKNVPNYDVIAVPADLPQNQDEKKVIYKTLEQTISMPEGEIEKKIKEKGERSPLPMVLKTNINRETSLILESRLSGLKGVTVQVNPIREYLDNGLLSHLLGYAGRISEEEYKTRFKEYEMTDYIGKTGIEYSYEKYLKGVNGKTRQEVDAQGRVIKSLGDIDPKNGNSLVLSVDFGLQKKMAESLRNGLDKAKVEKGVAIAMNPKTGEILGMVDLPSYDNNLFAKGISEKDYKKLLEDKNHPLIFRAISGEYPSGSTIKPFVAAGALKEGTITENTTVLSNGGIKIGEFEFPDWKKGGHGTTNVTKAIAESVNTFFYAIGGGHQNIRGLGPEKIKFYLEKFGFGKETGIDVPGEATGSIPDPDWKEKVKKEPWYLGDTYHMAIGQGDILATPLQMLSATSTIANGGSYLKPRVVSKIADNKGEDVKKFFPEVIDKDFFSADVVNVIKRGMRQTVTEGSGRFLNDLPFEVAGKTGTAQFSNDLSKKHAWFEAFAPYNDPEIAVLVLMEEAGGGDEFAVPVAKDILKWYFENKNKQ